VGLGPASLVPLHDKQPTMDSGTGITVRHESLREEWVLDKPHPNRGLSLRQDISAATNVVSRYT